MESNQEFFSAAHGLWRILQRKQNTHPDTFGDLDRALIQKYKEVVDKNAPPFDPKLVLRKS